MQGKCIFYIQVSVLSEPTRGASVARRRLQSCAEAVSVTSQRTRTHKNVLSVAKPRFWLFFMLHLKSGFHLMEEVPKKKVMYLKNK